MAIKPPFLGPVVLCLAIGHAVLMWYHRDERPVLDVLTPPPQPLFRIAAAAGDAQFLYRAWALDLQNAGDTGGRATPMRDYDYDFVLGWLSSLQSLDSRGHLHTHLASNYFSLSQNLVDVRRIVDFVALDSSLHPHEKWPWLMRAVQIALARLHDTELALNLSQQLVAYDSPDMPYGVFTLPAVFFEKLGRYAEARTAIIQVRERYADKMKPDDALWTNNFIQRLPRS